jgi:hypothetical protein
MDHRSAGRSDLIMSWLDLRQEGNAFIAQCNTKCHQVAGGRSPRGQYSRLCIWASHPDEHTILL